MTYKRFRRKHNVVNRPYIRKTYTTVNGIQYPNYYSEYRCNDCNATMIESETISSDGNSYDYRVEYTA